MRRRLLLAGIAVLVVILLAAGAITAYVLYVRHEGADVRGSSTVEFVPTEPTVAPPPPPHVTVRETVVWPTWGFDAQRTRFLPGSPLSPPFRRVWTFRARSLLEYPPAIAYGRLYLATNAGLLYALDLKTGKPVWHRNSARCVAASPAVWQQRVLVGSYSGDFYSLDAATGDVRWRFRANGPISGSATVLHGIVYFATLKQRTYALNAATGKLLWSFADGKYSPVVADAKRLYLVGYTHLYAMIPR